MATDLLFGRAQGTGLSPVELVFGADETVVRPRVDATLTASVPLPTLSAKVIPRTRVTLTATVPLPSLQADAVWDSNTSRPTVGQSATAWQPATSSEVGAHAGHTSTKALPQGNVTHWGAGLAASEQTTVLIPNNLAKQRNGNRAHHANAVQRVAGVASAHQQGVSDRRVSTTGVYQEAARIGSGTVTLKHQEGFRYTRRSVTDSFWTAKRLTARAHTSIVSPARWLNVGKSARHQDAKRPEPGVETHVVPALDPCYLPDTNLLFSQLAGDTELIFICERHTTPEPEQPGALVVVPVKRVYMVINETSLRRVSGNLALPAINASVSLDIDSWTWGFSATLPASSLADIEPGVSGEPVEVELLVNGTAVRALVESISRDRTFGKSSLRIQGRGISAAIGDTYAGGKSFTNASDLTGQQLAESVLTYNSASLGWGVNWSLPEWTVPAGVFSHQGSHMSALVAIATAAGGFVRPHGSNKLLSVMPRYKTAPWEWGSATPDFELPSAVTTKESMEWVDRPDFNRVYISGQAQGVLCQVTRAGTAGDLLAPMVTDQLITAAAPGRTRGIAELAKGGRIARLGLRLPVLAETGILLPGHMVRYVDGPITRIGQVTGVQVDVGGPEAWQSISMETFA